MNALFQPVRIRSLTLPNRFVRSATWTALASEGGECTERLFQCYENLARGGIGLIITGFAFVSREGQGPQNQLGIHDDGLAAGLKTLANRVHALGGRIAVQIAHCGSMSNAGHNGGLEAIGPSDRCNALGKRVARAMTLDEIRRVVSDFGAAAGRAKKAGFDAVQLHFAHGYLGSQFLSPYFNRRSDEYGGPLEGRCRFLREAYLAVRGAVGEAYPVMAKLNIEDCVGGGLPAKEGLRAAALLAELGIDAIEVSGGMLDSGRLGPARRLKTEADEAYFLANAAAVKKIAGAMPVMLVGGLRTPAKMLRIHEEAGIDCFSMSRPFIREPRLIERWKSGDEAPAECASCSGCFLSVKQGRGVFCIKTRRDKPG